MMIAPTIVAILMLVVGCTNDIKPDFNREWMFWSDTQTTPQVINLPHDAMQTEPRSNDVPEGRHNGFYPGNVYHYEKTFNATADLLQKHVTLNFEGVYRNSKIYVNGKEAGGYQYGYMPFDVCLDGLLVEGENTIEIQYNSNLLNELIETGIVREAGMKRGELWGGYNATYRSYGPAKATVRPYIQMDVTAEDPEPQEYAQPENAPSEVEQLTFPALAVSQYQE